MKEKKEGKERRGVFMYERQRNTHISFYEYCPTCNFRIICFGGLEPFNRLPSHDCRCQRSWCLCISGNVHAWSIQTCKHADELLLNEGQVCISENQLGHEIQSQPPGWTFCTILELFRNRWMDVDVLRLWPVLRNKIQRVRVHFRSFLTPRQKASETPLSRMKIIDQRPGIMLTRVQHDVYKIASLHVPKWLQDMWCNFWQVSRRGVEFLSLLWNRGLRRGPTAPKSQDCNRFFEPCARTVNAAATAGFEPRTIWPEVRRRIRLATTPPQNTIISSRTWPRLMFCTFSLDCRA